MFSNTGRRSARVALATVFLLAFLAVAPTVALEQVGEVRPANITTALGYPGSEDGSLKRVWQHTISEPGASYIAVHFRDFLLAPGDYLEISDPSGAQSYRMSGRGKMGAGTFWARHIKGDTMRLELYASSSQGAQGFVITDIAEGYGDIGGGSPEAICGADDKENAVCYETSHPVEYDKARAVARLLINGSGLCTGWLVSPSSHLVTNEHCISSASAALNTDYEFMAQAPNCGDGNCQLCHAGDVFSGATFLQDSASLDYALVQINSGDPASLYGYMEIDDRVALVEEEIYIPQHPGGRAKELGIFSSDASDDGGICRVFTTGSPPCSGSGFNDVGYFCDTEGGSSGSPVLARSSHKVIALHHCANCPNRGVPINLVFEEIESFLCTAQPSPLNVTSSVPGDNQIELSWNDADESTVIEYTVERSRTAGGPYTVIATLADASPGVANGPAMSYTDNDVSGGASYFYVVRANDGASCESNASNEVSEVGTGACTLAPIFNGISVVNTPPQNVCTLDLAWGPAADECGGPISYNVYRSTQPGFTPGPTNLVASGLTTTVYSDFDQLIAGTVYRYVVRAVDAANAVEDGNTAQASGSPLGSAGACTTVSACSDNPFVDVQPENMTACANTGFLLNAVTTGGAGAFNYQWTRDGQPIPGATQPTYAPVALGTHQYNVQVQAAGCSDSIFDGLDSSVLLVNAPFFDGATSVTNSHTAVCGLDVAWDPGTTVCSGPVRYFVYRDTASPVATTPGNLVAAGIAGSGFTDAAELASGATYHYLVQAQDASTGQFDGNTVEVSGFADGPGSGPQTVLDEDFEDPGSFSGWSVTTGPGVHTCGEWALSSSGGSRPTGGSGSHALADNQCHPLLSRTSTTMTSPSVSTDLPNTVNVKLEFDMWYNHDGNESGTVEIYDGSSWVTVWQDTNSDLNGHRSIDVTAQALGNTNFQVRFDYQDATQDQFFSVDNVQVIVLVEVACATAAAGPPTVPDGSAGTTPLIGSRASLNGDSIDLAWDSGCPAADYNLLYGDLANVSSATIDGSQCGLSGTGTHSWAGVPAGDLFFIVVTDDGSGTESGWGVDGFGAERNGGSASGQCSNSSKDASGSCP